ncbi:MAG: hypothetical protein ABSE16_11405 [Verrucomicrobiota bacterium]|jgi:hypothetical protein
MVVQLRDCDEQDAQELSSQIRMFLSEWLTVPVPFDGGIHQAVETLGSPVAVEARWGSAFRVSYESALEAAARLPKCENPLRQKLLAVFRDLRSRGRSLKIFCHRRARPHFESILPAGEPLFGDDCFLHSVRDYRDSDVFDVLVKVGPLRSRGWGAAPDALLTAPRFTTIVQAVWSGCGDEPDFGYDPTSPPASPSGLETQPRQTRAQSANRVQWNKLVTHSGDAPSGPSSAEPDSDELQLFRDLNQPREKRHATLLQIDDEEGILYPPHAQVLSFNPSEEGRDPLDRRVPGETLLEGMYLIRTVVGDVETDGPQSAEGRYAPTWKAKLNAAYRQYPNAFASRLLLAGLYLMNMHACIKHWCRPTTTVIHAPQKMAHFKILIEVLGINFEQGTPRAAYGVPWWQYAWNEIRRTRGEAIQSGLHEQEIIEAQALTILRELLPEIQSKATQGSGFHLPIPAGKELNGAFLFNRVSAIEEGFLAPDTELKVVCDLHSIEQWRD